jgi:hypothetical protein
VKCPFAWLVALFLPVCAYAQFEIKQVNDKTVEVVDNGRPIFDFNYGMMLKPGTNPDRTRCCYLAPVYTPNGVAITDDFPKDHPHHRGIFWAWPVVKVDGQTYDLWTIKGIHAHFSKWLAKEAHGDSATLSFEDRWFVGDRPVVEERVTITAHAAKAGDRDLDFTISLKALVDGVEIAGQPDQQKGYGGLSIRFAPRTNTVITIPDNKNAPDSDLTRAPWAQVTGDFNGREAGARITTNPENPGFPNAWCLRHYGFLGANYPGLATVKLSTAKDLTMKYRVTLLGKSPKS